MVWKQKGQADSRIPHLRATERLRCERIKAPIMPNHKICDPIFGNVALHFLLQCGQHRIRHIPMSNKETRTHREISSLCRSMESNLNVPGHREDFVGIIPGAAALTSHVPVSECCSCRPGLIVHIESQFARLAIWAKHPLLDMTQICIGKMLPDAFTLRLLLRHSDASFAPCPFSHSMFPPYKKRPLMTSSSPGLLPKKHSTVPRQISWPHRPYP